MISQKAESFPVTPAKCVPLPPRPPRPTLCIPSAAPLPDAGSPAQGAGVWAGSRWGSPRSSGGVPQRGCPAGRGEWWGDRSPGRGRSLRVGGLQSPSAGAQVGQQNAAASDQVPWDEPESSHRFRAVLPETALNRENRQANL